MSEEQIKQLKDGIKELSLEIKLVWQKLNEIQITMAGQGANMRHSAKDIDKHIEESDTWRRLVMTAVVGSITSIIVAVASFVTVKVTLEKHIEYANKYFDHIEIELNKGLGKQ